MKRQINGKECVSGEEARKMFFASNELLIKWAKQGMPHIISMGTYYYPIKDCQLWFAGGHLNEKT